LFLSLFLLWLLLSSSLILLLLLLLLSCVPCRQGKPESEGWLEGCGVRCSSALDLCSAGGGGPHAAVCPQAAGGAAGHTPHLGPAPAEVCTKSRDIRHRLSRHTHLGIIDKVDTVCTAIFNAAALLQTDVISLSACPAYLRNYCIFNSWRHDAGALVCPTDELMIHDMTAIVAPSRHWLSQQALFGTNKTKEMKRKYYTV